MNNKKYILNRYRALFGSHARTGSVVILQPNHLTSMEWLALKEKMSTHGITFHVVKNKLMFVALECNVYRNIESAFKGPNALAVVEHVRDLGYLIPELAVSKNKLQLLWGVVDGVVHTPNYYNKYLGVNNWPELMEFTRPLLQLVELLSAPLVQLQYIIRKREVIDANI